MNCTWRKKEEQIAERQKILESAEYGLPEKVHKPTYRIGFSRCNASSSFVEVSDNRLALIYQYTSWASYIDNAIDEVGGLRWPKVG
jgi:hypothetical protein